MKGLYFLASDKTYDLVIAFLNSVRAFEPQLPMCCIPYDDKIERIRELADAYNFNIWSDQSSLERCDAISTNFHEKILGQYRKLVIWNGSYDQFAYIDTDTVLLRNLDIAFELLCRCDVLTAISNISTIRQFVWTGNVSHIMPDLDTEYSANTGFIISRKGLISLEDAEKKADEAQPIKHLMALECTEQPFLNYAIVTSGVRYTSFSQIRSTDKETLYPKEIWAGMLREDLLSLEMLPQLIHWAGRWQGGDHLRSATWRHFRHLRDGSEVTSEKSLMIP